MSSFQAKYASERQLSPMFAHGKTRLNLHIETRHGVHTWHPRTWEMETGEFSQV